MIRSRAEDRPRTIGRGPSGRKGAQIVQERISRRSRLRRREAATRVRRETLIGGTDGAPEDKMVPVGFAPVSRMFYERSKDVQAETADPPVRDGSFEIWQGRDQRIERRSIVTELDRQLSAFHSQR